MKMSFTIAPAGFRIDLVAMSQTVFWPKKKSLIILIKKNVDQKMNHPIPWICQIKNVCHSKSLQRKTATKKRRNFRYLLWWYPDACFYYSTKCDSCWTFWTVFWWWFHCIYCTQIEAKQNINSNLTLLKYVCLWQCCFLLDIIYCLEESFTRKIHQTSTMLLCQTPCLANFLKRYCLYFILVTKWIQINRTKWPKLDHFLTWPQSLVLKIDQILQISLLMNQWCLIMFKTIVNRECKVNLFDLDVRCGSLLSLLDMQLLWPISRCKKWSVNASMWKDLGSSGDCCSLSPWCFAKANVLHILHGLFITVWLLKFLATNNIRASEIMRQNRLDKFEHGAIDFRTWAQKNVTFVAWKDNHSVHAVSNCNIVKPFSQVQRSNKPKQAKVAIS